MATRAHNTIKAWCITTSRLKQLISLEFRLLLYYLPSADYIATMSKQLSLYQYLHKRRCTEQIRQQITSGTNVATCSSSGTSGSSSRSIPDDIASSPECLSVQPVDIQFQITYFSSKACSFNPDWFRLYLWLEYSVQKDAAYCYPCRLFSIIRFYQILYHK